MNQSNIEMNSGNKKLPNLEKFERFYCSEKYEEYISFVDIIKKYDLDNLSFLSQSEEQEYDKIKNDLEHNFSITPIELQNYYSTQILEAIKSIQKSKIYAELPKLPFGKSLNDNEFLELLNKCVSYANYNLDQNILENIKNRLLKKMKILKSIFKKPQILKDLLENVLLIILTADNKANQDDNFEILSKSKISTLTPLIKLDFNLKNNNHKIDKKELIETFCSNIYIQNYYKALDQFIPNFKSIVKDEESLKIYIKNYFEKYNIYFCKLPQYMMALTLHTGNIYLKVDYLEEYFEENDEDSLVIIREKIILNLGHELMHGLMREINPEMTTNYFIKSKKKIKEENNQIKFKDKFISNFHLFDANESGNVFDHNFFDGYYFDKLYEKEAHLFLGIKNMNTIGEYKIKLNSVIFSEQSKQLSTDSVNKFKKLEKERPRCKRPGAITLNHGESKNGENKKEKYEN